MTIFLNSTDVHQIAEAIDTASCNVISAYSQVSAIEPMPYSIGPERIATALSQFLDIMYLIEVNKNNEDIAHDLGYDQHDCGGEWPLNGPLNSGELTEIGNYGLDLMQTLSEWAQRLSLPEDMHQLQSAMIVVSLWIARQGGSLTTIDLIVETLNEVVKATIEPEVLLILSEVMGELVNAVAAEIKTNQAPQHLRKTWRDLNKSWGIVATRTKDIGVIQKVYDQLVENIPQHVPLFFKRALLEPGNCEFSIAVSEVITSYYQRYTVRVIH